MIMESDNYKLWSEYTVIKHRVFGESDRIDKEIKLLKTKIKEGKLAKAEIEQRELLDQQLAAMTTYESILNKRWSLLWDRCEEIAAETEEFMPEDEQGEDNGNV